MKVELTPTITNQKTNLFTKIKRFFVGKLKFCRSGTACTTVHNNF